jgi:hypothetical protein
LAPVSGDDVKPPPAPPKESPAPPSSLGRAQNAVVKQVLDKNVNTDKAIQTGQFTGKIVTVAESKKSLRLSIPLQVPQRNHCEAKWAADEAIEYMQALYRGDANAAAAHLLSWQEHQAKIYSLGIDYKVVELKTTDDVKVRLANPPLKVNEKGKIAPLSATERQKLKGPDPQLPGYMGEFSDLTQDQVVTVTLVRKKGEGPRLPPPVRGKPVDPTALLENLGQVSVILVLVDPNAKPPK